MAQAGTAIDQNIFKTAARRYRRHAGPVRWAERHTAARMMLVAKVGTLHEAQWEP